MGQCRNNRAACGLGLSLPPGFGKGHTMDIKPGDRRTLAAGTVFHLIPMLKVEGLAAIGCTETVVVTASGQGSLNTLPRELIRR